MEEVPIDERWVRFWERVAPRESRREYAQPFEVLCTLYGEEHRAYHDLMHIEYCLRQLDVHRALAQDADAVEMALWFHDVIYNTHPQPKGLPGNEARSAAVAEEILCMAGFELAFRQKVVDLIMVTRHLPGGAKTPDEMLMADIDWSPMGWSWEQFQESRRKIRHEYGHLSDEVFNAGRRKFLLETRDHTPMFYLTEFRQRFEARVYDNIARELETLYA